MVREPTKQASEANEPYVREIMSNPPLERKAMLR